MAGNSQSAAIINRKQSASLRFIPVNTIDHVLSAIDLGREFHEESRYNHIQFSEEKFLQVHKKLLLNSSNSFGLLVELDGKVIGAMGAEIGEYYIGNGYLIATIRFLYIASSVRKTVYGGRIAIKLVRAFTEWARSNGAQELNIHATSGIAPSRTDRFFRGIGLRPYGGNYAIKLS